MPDAIRVPSLRLTELDGSPDIQGVERIYLTNGFLSSLGGGAALLSLSGSGGGFSLTIQEVDGSPSVAGVTTIKVPNTTLTDNTGGVVTLASPLAMQDIDGTPNVSNVSRIYTTNGFLSDLGSGSVLLSMSGGGGGGAPTTADYWVETADAGLSAEVVVGTTGITTAAYASRQAAAKAGRLFLPSDSFYVERDTGSAWAPWGPVFPFTVPVDGDFSWYNQGGATTSTTNGGVFLSVPSSATTDFRGRTKTKSAPYTITAAVMTLTYPANFVHFGLFFTDGTKVHVFGIGYNTQTRLLSTKFTNATTISADYSNVINNSYLGSVMWLRIADDNANRICSYSTDGVNFLQFHSIGRTDFLTATSVGWGGSTQNSNAGGVTLLSWKET